MIRTNLKFISDPSLPMFPVESEWMATVRQRVHLARRLDKLELQARRVNAEHGWLDKAVKEMDLALSDDELYPFFNF